MVYAQRAAPLTNSGCVGPCTPRRRIGCRSGCVATSTASGCTIRCCLARSKMFPRSDHVRTHCPHHLASVGVMWTDRFSRGGWIPACNRLRVRAASGPWFFSMTTCPSAHDMFGGYTGRLVRGESEHSLSYFLKTCIDASHDKSWRW